MATDKKISEAIKIDFDSSICDSPMSVLSSSLKGLSTNSLKKVQRKRLPWSSPNATTPSPPSHLSVGGGLSSSPSYLVDSPMIQQRILRRNLKFKESPDMSGNKENTKFIRRKSSSGTTASEDSQDSGYSASLASSSQGSFTEALETSSSTEFGFDRSEFFMDDNTMSQHSFDQFLNSKQAKICKPVAERELQSPLTKLHPENNFRTSTCIKENLRFSFKRPIQYSPADLVSESEVKKIKLFKSCSLSEIELRACSPRSPLKENNSLNICPIKEALQKSSEDTSLIGDFSKPHSLPLTKGKHQDLQTIDSQTLSNLMEGKYDTKVRTFKVVDCRYPYEYEGGHIKEALNIYTKESVLETFFSDENTSEQDVNSAVLIFHCEFSSERGPGLCRFLRNRDRAINSYPKLHFPEIYLLEGGYKTFFEHFPQLCEPESYLPMLHRDHCKDLRKFRAKSKSWAGEKCSRPTKRVASGLKF